jgi:hypothetical protein
MKRSFLAIAAAAITALPLTAHAQGTVRGAEEGAAAGDRAAGPVGAVVGGAVGAATGTVGGILGVDDRPRFRDYAVRERRHAHRYRLREKVGVGTVLPEQGVTLYAVPPTYHVNPAYRYAYVNDEVVLVDPYSRRIVEVID